MDELEKAVPAAEGMVNAEQSTPSGRHNTHCLNCGTELKDVFCHHCGQKDIPRRQTLGELWSNFISSFWSYEGKFFQTTRYLLTKPGFLAIEYNAGRRESYYHPARMYAFISFVFFLFFFSFQDSDTENDLEENQEETVALADSVKAKGPDVDSLFTELGKDSVVGKVFRQPWADSVKAAAKRDKKKNGNGTKFNLSKTDFATVEAYDSAEQLKPEAERDGWFERRMTIRSIELNKRFKNNSENFGKEFIKAFMDNFSKVLFFLLPFFALLLKLLYVRRDYFYSEHLVFSIYYYNFCYLAGSLQLLLSEMFSTSWIGLVITLWILGYLLLGMKRMYAQGWGKTLVKYFLFGFLFSIVALIGFSINLFVVLLII